MTLPFTRDTPSDARAAHRAGAARRLARRASSTASRPRCSPSRCRRSSQFEEMRQRRRPGTDAARRPAAARRVPRGAAPCLHPNHCRTSVGSRRGGGAVPRPSSPSGPTRTRSKHALVELRAMPPLVFAGEAAHADGVARAVGAGQRLPAARGRLRGVVRRVLRRQHPRQAQGHPADVGGADVQHRRTDPEGRAHRRPVRQAAVAHPPRSATASSCRRSSATW